MNRQLVKKLILIEVGISIDDIWVGNTMDYRLDKDTDKLTINLGTQGQQIEGLLY